MPGDSYERIPARTFAVPSATITRARELADALSGRTEAEVDEAEVDEAEAGQELRTLYDGIPAVVQADLIADWLGTGKRHDHPVYPFLVWAGVPSRLDARKDVLANTDTPADPAADVDDPDQLWRRLCSVEYTIHVRECGNDGPPESDLPTSDQQAEAASIAARLSEMVQIPAGTLRARAGGAAFAHGQDPGTDDDPDRFAPPDWAEVRVSGWPGW